MNFTHTSFPFELKLPKLVRDNIPDMIRNNDKIEPKFHIAKDNDEFRSFALHKLVEEATEVSLAQDKIHLTEELADLKELTNSIMENFDINDEDVEKIRIEKKSKNGGFEKKYILDSK